MNEELTMVIGLVLGLLLRIVLPGTRTLGVIFTAVLGVGGAFGGVAICQALHWFMAGEPEELIAAAVGCGALLLSVGLLKRASR